MREDNVGWFAVVLVVLAPALRCNVCGDTNVDDDVFLAGMLVDFQAADYEEPVAAVQFIGQAAEFRMQLWERKGLLRYVSKG
jgi:hypothetical protein